MKKLFVFFIILFLFPHFVLAGLEISEIMYDLQTGSDDGREWVEVFNNSDTEVDFSAFRFFEADTNHKLTLAQGDAKIPARGYVVIVSNFAKFKTDWPSFPGIIFDSTFSFNNTGETLALKEEEDILDSVTYQSSQGGAGDGKSLQKINGVWQGAVPTPGAENKITYIPPLKKSLPPKITTPNQSPVGDGTGQAPPMPEVPSPPLEATPEDGQGGAPEAGGGYLFSIILVPFLGAGAGAVYFIRRRGKVAKIGDDFQILEP